MAEPSPPSPIGPPSPRARRPAGSGATDGSHLDDPEPAVVPPPARRAAVPVAAARAASDDGWALVVLALSAVTDWADGKLARLLDQYSRLGALLDPAADRLYILAALIGFVLRGFIPWWVAALIIGRDVLLALRCRCMRRYGYAALPVHYLGKAATFCCSTHCRCCCWPS